jgi:hypothetical protein
MEIHAVDGGMMVTSRIVRRAARLRTKITKLCTTCVDRHVCVHDDVLGHGGGRLPVLFVALIMFLHLPNLGLLFSFSSS